MSAEQELLPCPFCGETPDYEVDGHFVTEDYKWGCLSCSCSASGPETRTGYEDVSEWKAAAAKEWNTRAPHPAEARVAELEAAITSAANSLDGLSEGGDGDCWCACCIPEERRPTCVALAGIVKSCKQALAQRDGGEG